MTPFEPSILPPQIEERLRSELRADEKLLWSGQPLPRLFRRQVYMHVLVGFALTSLSLYVCWVGRDWREVRLFFIIFGGSMFLIGLALMCHPIAIHRQARRVVYAITDQRVILIAGRMLGFIGLPSFNIESHIYEHLAVLLRTEHADGTGDLKFEQLLGDKGFIGIERVRDVENLIRETSARLLAGRK